MFCKNCGKELPESAKFCSSCGTPVAPAPEEPEGQHPAEDAAPAPESAPVTEEPAVTAGESTQTAADGAAAYMHRLGFDALGPEYALHLTQRYGGVAVFMRASVDHKDLHCSPHLFVQDMPRPYGTGRMCILYIRGRFFATCTNEA